MTHAECVTAATYWLIPKCDITLPEFFCWNNELADVIGFKTGGQSIMIECKVSRSDFLRDKKKSFRRLPDMGMGNQRYYCCPTGLIKPTELPEKWGLIYVYPSGYIKRIVGAGWQPKNMAAEHHLLFYYARRAVHAGVHSSVLAHRSGI